MGDCVSVVVRWNLAGVRYDSVRGWHGMGGIGAIDFNQSFAGVPNQGTTQVIVVASNMGSVSYLLDEVSQRITGHLNAANIRVCKGFSNERITRSGQVTKV